MPIRPENVKRYPKHWKTVIVPRIAARAGGRCECAGECGLVHESSDMATGEPRCDAENGKHHPRTGSKVVLTVAHLDHTPEQFAISAIADLLDPLIGGAKP